MEENALRESLLSQLSTPDDQFFVDLIDQYMFFWRTCQSLQEDVKNRGVVVKYQNGKNQWGYKRNESIQELVKVNGQMLKILMSIGIKPPKPTPPVEEPANFDLI